MKFPLNQGLPLQRQAYRSSKKMDGKWVDQVAKQPIFPETNATNGYHAAYEAPNIINVESPN